MTSSNDKYPRIEGLTYPHKLNFYDQPPLYDVTIEDFETCALDRLRVLAEIEASAARGRTWDETKTVTRGHLNKYVPLSTAGNELDTQEILRRRDHLGHFVLRLAFCRTEELRRRFIKAEVTLFKVRYEAEVDSEERKAFLNTRNFNWISVEAEEKQKYQAELLAASYQDFRNIQERTRAFNNDRFYKVRWTRVPDLVQKRRVFLKRGMAYVPGREQASIIYQEFETDLQKALEVTARALPRLDEDSRIVPVLNNLSQGFLAGVSSDWTGNTLENAGDEIKAEMIDDIASKHYPLCMRNMHDKLRRNRHLPHFERLNYGLFLKVLGLSIDEAITFWRKSFMGGKIREDQFNREHKYNIRHSYGLEGRRANYPAKSCQHLLVTDESSAHGCPYRFNEDNLPGQLLSAYGALGLTSNHLPEIMQQVKTKHYHIACTRVFEITHGGYGVKKGEGVDGESVTHPNQYAARGIELERAQRAGSMDVE